MTQSPSEFISKPLRNLSKLSASQQALVRLCQSIDYGQIIDLRVCGGEPVFSPAPTVLQEVRLDTIPDERPECMLSDFILRDEVCRLLDQIDALKDGRIERIEVRAGIPRRAVIERSLWEVPQ